MEDVPSHTARLAANMLSLRAGMRDAHRRLRDIQRLMVHSRSQQLIMLKAYTAACDEYASDVARLRQIREEGMF